MASKMTGAADVAAALRKLGSTLQPAVNAAARKSMAPVLKAAKANVPIDDGDLRRSLVVRKQKSPKGTTRFAVGPSNKFTGKDGDRPVKYAHVVEFGSADGTKPARRPLTRAYESTKDEAQKVFGKEIGPAVERQAAKVAARAKR